MLLKQALKCEITVTEFWQLTPRETFLTMDAFLWRQKGRRRERIQTAWLTAALTRAKRLPKLSQLLIEKARPIYGRELEERRQEFKEMMAGIDLNSLNKQAQNK